MNLQEATRDVVERHRLEKWFLRVPEGRDYARDIIKYLVAKLPKHAHILELGSGIAQNLVVLNKLGFERVAGVELDQTLYTASLELCELTDAKVELVCGDAESVSFYGKWEAILPINWTYRAGVDIAALLKNLHARLCDHGEVIIDIIDSSLPADQSPEYVQRFNLKEVMSMTAGLYCCVKTSEYMPRIVYHLEKI